MTKTLFVLLVLASIPYRAAALIVDACQSSVSASSGILFSCPARDGASLSDAGVTIDIHVKDAAGTPIPGVPKTDIWLVGCPQNLSLCGGSGAINATAPTDINGHTTITGKFAASGCASGVYVVVQGLVIRGSGCPGGCLSISVRSPDVIGPGGGPPDLRVDLLDLARFGQQYPAPPQSYNECLDYSIPYGVVTVQDFAKWGSHMMHSCF